MGSVRRNLVEHGKSGRSTTLSLNESMCETVVTQVIERVRASGYEEAVCSELREHFARLPARYTLNIDVQRHDDVLLHMRLLQEALEADVSSCKSPSGLFPLPAINVRKVQLGNGSPQLEAEDIHSDNEHGSRWKGIPIPKIPKPAFGSGGNLTGLLTGSPARIHPSVRHVRSQSRGTSRSTPPSTGNSPIPRPMFGSFTNLVDMDDEECSSGHEDSNSTYGYEVTFASSDRHGLLKYFTSALSSSSLELNIKEAHVFSTTNGMALEVFVVEGWPGDEPEELRQAVLSALSSKLNDMSTNKGGLDADSQLRAVAEAIAYEDWAVDYNNLVIGERLGGGSSGRLYRGKYLSQDVAIKIILLDEEHAEPDVGTSSAKSATKLLQIFKQEVSIMRLVRHKNLVQFIGACASWPKLCIVTELMAGGSVRDLLESRACGLEISTAVKVLRDAARGMDFLHRSLQAAYFLFL
ncbi:hypothetical protein O6H91_19G033800 [Diphasiastrum complanatum]|uniref:Uncharacterized protein n=1 Tax=Diphasiastrum complanatum TaxID=34168 RepID=A0ACC2ATY3_DIPCM|nr:hypothetical protein O6H91_19G033800 [Diphasiastrum complanatum]